MLTAVLLVAAAAATSSELPVISIPNGSAGIAFGDLVYSSTLKRILVPGGRAGNITLIDPETRAISLIGGLSSSDTYDRKSAFGVTSVAAGEGLLYATDRTTRELLTIDVGRRKVVSRAKLEAEPETIRFVPSRQELWITEPGREQMEIFSSEDPRSPKAVGTIEIEGGPYSLVIDEARGRAYSNSKDTTLIIALETREIQNRWDNQCQAARGLALDEEHNLLFAGCAGGKVVSMRDGAIVSRVDTGEAVEAIAYAAGRLFVPAGDPATITIFGVDGDGNLKKLRKVNTATGGHCVAADPRGRAYVCDPSRGRLLVVDGQ